LGWPGKKQSQADFPFTDVWISFEIFPNALFEREIGSVFFLAWPTQTQTALLEDSLTVIYNLFIKTKASGESLSNHIRAYEVRAYLSVLETR
jgi:hypothetical protein